MILEQMRRVSDILADFLAERGVRHAFGIGGAGNVHLFDSIARRGFTQIVRVHHEQAAAMAMQTYYRTCGRMAACLLTTGGGSSNGVTGVVSAWMDSIPGLVLSGNEHSRYTNPDNPLRTWGVQGYDSVAMVRGVTKYAARVMDPDRALPALQQAWDEALSGRPGPAWVDVPMDVQAAQVDPDVSAAAPDNQAVTHEEDAEQDGAPGEVLTDATEGAARILQMLRGARRPVVWLGHGLRLAGAAALVEPLLWALGSPALLTWAGMDMVDHRHPLHFGSAGVYGQRCANFVLQSCDLLVCLGTRLSIPQIGHDPRELARGAQIIVNDIDSHEAQKLGERVALAVVADAGALVGELLRQAADAPVDTAPFAEWIERCEGYRRRYPRIGPEHADRDGFINSYRFMDRLSEHLKPDQVVVTDTGTPLLSGHQALRLRGGQRLMASTGLGEVGGGLPGAIGASFARGGGEVLCLNSDGGMMMNLQELQTIAHHRLPVKIIVFNHDGPDFSALAGAFGLPAYQLRTWADFDAAVPALLGEIGPAICEVFMHPEQLFVPHLPLSVGPDGQPVSPPLEDLSPPLPLAELRDNLLVELHEKSERLARPR